MAIEKLPLLLVNQIAAGEVIERPASVVKELIENSLDARASRIDITVEAGGAELIRISDDGEGITAEDLPLAVAPHATSKIRTAEHLEAIGTLGFRGEALASIASVSRMRITSRPIRGNHTADQAAAIEAAGEHVGEVSPAASKPGTVIEIRDLFFNTPARRKFMRAPGTEIGHIHETVNRAAMANPQVAFSVTHQGRKTIDLPAAGSRKRRCVEILGKDVEEGLLEFEQGDERDRGETRVWGLAGQPALCRATGKFIYLCLNGRPIKDRNLLHAVREAYRGLVPSDKHPMAVVFVEMPPAAVDVNVHPTKAEVRFRRPQQIHSLVLTAVRQRLLGSDLTPAATFASGNPSSNRSFSFQPGPGQASDHQPISTDQFVDFFKKMDPTEKGFVYEQVKQAYDAGDPQLADHAAPAQTNGQGDPAAAIRRQSILQVHDAYVVTQDEQGLLIVDQHALHERVMFEELRHRVLGEGKALESQRMLMPAVVDADEAEQTAIEELTPLLERIGMEIQPLGPRSVGIQAFASFLFDRGVEPGEFLRALLDKVANGEIQAGSASTKEAALHEVLDMMACKAAVKAGDRLSEDEIAALLAKRDQVERASNCPHGRPTTIRLSLRDLEKQFKRT